ncbi:uncharacterized protein LOC122456749 [Dermochelys coriacea]|uniref:uncharacterized protein LOC122456749 n=1 Tax=Dermochelys coriacea TaxID=27794 RepID=UPI001CA95156|nr:uncharacterized protein LOC122456749 [Dermochelys coriacea]
MTVSILFSGSTSETFVVQTGVKQGSVLASTLFSILLAAMKTLTQDCLPQSIGIQYQTGSNLFNLSHLRARTKVILATITELQCADDWAVVARSKEDLQTNLNFFSQTYKSLGLTLNIAKTKVLHPLVPSKEDQHRQRTGNVEYFACLGSHFSQRADIDFENQQKLCCASLAFGRLSHWVFNNHNIGTQGRLLVYKVVVISTLLCGGETWVTYRKHLKNLERQHQRFLWKILNIKWEDCHTNVSVLTEANIFSVEALIIPHYLRWSGHCVGMPDICLPELLYPQLTKGERKQGGQNKCFKDILKINIKKSGIDTRPCETVAQDRDNWQRLCQRGNVHF